MRRIINSFSLAGCLALLFLVSTSDARLEKSLGYTKNQSYKTALRYLRIDRGYKIVERDLEAGYLMFEYPGDSDSATSGGSIEVVEREHSVALIIQLPQMPHYHERMLAAGLLKKLKADYGAPPASRKSGKSKPKQVEEPKAKEDPKDGPPSSPPRQSSE